MARTGFIFDMDDTLAATGPLWRVAKGRLLQSIGQEFNDELRGRLRGLSALDFAAALHEEFRPALPLADFQQRFRELLLAAFRADPPAQIPGAADLVRRCAGHGAPRGKLAVASGSPPDVIDFTLSHLGLAGVFGVTISSEAVKRGKPHPDVFLAAAERLGVPPAACIVFEDSLVGAQAAHAAGMKAIVRPSLANANINDYATRVCECWSEITAEELNRIMGGQAIG